MTRGDRGGVIEHSNARILALLLDKRVVSWRIGRSSINRTLGNLFGALTVILNRVQCEFFFLRDHFDFLDDHFLFFFLRILGLLVFSFFDLSSIFFVSFFIFLLNFVYMR